VSRTARLAASLVLCATLLVPAALGTSATRTDPRPGTAPRMSLPAMAPGAQLQIVGAGSVTADGNVVVYGVLKGRFALQVQDLAGGAKVTLNGGVLRFNRRNVVTRPGARGRLYIQGANVRVRLAGGQLQLSMAGRGVVTLAGAGSVQLNGAAAQPWTGFTGPIELTPPA
jgi:hypothetical protein